MRVQYKSEELRLLATDKAYQPKRFHADLVRAYRKAIGLLHAAESQRDLRAFRGLRLKKLKGNRQGQHSIRVNDQWRIIVRFEQDESGQTVVVIEFGDYH